MAKRAEIWLQTWRATDPSVRQRITELAFTVRESALVADRSHRLVKYPRCFVCFTFIIELMLQVANELLE